MTDPDNAHRADRADNADKAHRADRERRRAGLCADCVFARQVTSARGSTFYWCERSVNDPAFPRYPRLPVVECRGYEPRESERTRPES